MRYRVICCCPEPSRLTHGAASGPGALAKWPGKVASPDVSLLVDNCVPPLLPWLHPLQRQLRPEPRPPCDGRLQFSLLDLSGSCNADIHLLLQLHHSSGCVLTATSTPSSEWLALEGQHLTAGSGTATVEELSDSAVTALHCGLWLDAPYHPHILFSQPNGILHCSSLQRLELPIAVRE